jgi:hypothetical protein
MSLSLRSRLLIDLIAIVSPSRLWIRHIAFPVISPRRHWRITVLHSLRRMADEVHAPPPAARGNSNRLPLAGSLTKTTKATTSG